MKKLLSLLLTSGLFFTGCASVKDNAGKRTGLGAGVGVAAGAVAGALLGGKNKAKGAMIGGAVGGLLGGSVGLYLDKRKKELERVAQTQVTQDGNLKSKFQGDITFGSNSATVTPTAQAQIAQFAGIMAQYPNDRLTIKGYTDSQGSTTWNNTLSAKRAQAVRNILANGGVTGSVQTLGLGSALPLADNSTTAGRAQNRRVEIEILVDKSQVQ